MIKDNSYNIVTSLSEKSKSLQLYDKYIQDAQEADSPECAELWRHFKQQDEQSVQQLTQHVEMLIQNGKF